MSATRRTFIVESAASALALAVSTRSLAATVPKEAPRTTGILVLDNCDPKSSDKRKYEDNLTFLDASGKHIFRVSGLNSFESIGSSHMIATDPSRKCLWVVENIKCCVRRFDFTGRETL